jgi:hypothetical protein
MKANEPNEKSLIFDRNKNNPKRNITNDRKKEGTKLIATR